MEEKIIIAPNYIEINDDDILVFLAGPIQGAQDWHSNAIDIIKRMDSRLWIASPRGREGDYREGLNDERRFAQYDWETKHLRRAGKKGVIIFWLAKEKEKILHRAYAQTSRLELGEWKTMAQNGKARIAIGIEEGFTGARYIRRRFSQDLPQVPIYSTLEDTCKKAVELAREI